ncbi:hypothetical protein GCM10010430_10570 [Kitasatospora cystarginea]|uniref:Uncharacterized protein n=1 Tax=Kitasatospora cystarginea TaxID=58350 RepID=A0ABN3DIE8_9ACTN
MCTAVPPPDERGRATAAGSAGREHRRESGRTPDPEAAGVVVDREELTVLSQ